MILGLYADLHANLPALQGMQAALGRVDRWVALGDSVGLFPQVNEVLDWQRANDVAYVRGDHEEALVKGGGIPGSFTGTESIRSQARAISPENLATLADLPEARDLEADGVRIRATHFLTPEARGAEGKYAMDLPLLERLYRGYDFVFFGHTHLPAVLYGRDTVFINPGSAGFPVDVERRCSAVVFDASSRRFDFVRFDYDTNALTGAVEGAGYNPKLAAYVRNNHRWV